MAKELQVSLRTLYRDIATLQEQGAHIEGAGGLGYVLRPGFLLPPMMLSTDELEALVLGSKWVADRLDADLKQAAESAMAKIAAVLPPHLRANVEHSTLLIGPASAQASIHPKHSLWLSAIRVAMRKQVKAEISYRDSEGKETVRIVWPFGLGVFDTVRILMAHCELRGGFRNFRLDRMGRFTPLELTYPRSRVALLAEWKAQDRKTPDRI